MAKQGYIRSHQLQAAFAQRREQEHMRIERTEAVNRYYNHWDKVTARFSNWVGPEYYKKAEEQFKQRKEKKQKEEELGVRRERLQKLLAKESEAYQIEKQALGKGRLRKHTPSNETLQKIDENAKERERIKRKLELEAKLYGRWRHGVDDENLVFESKSSNETLAKLNWLDKKVEEQQQREREEAEAQARNLQLQEEIRKTEEAQMERQLIREQEIKEIRALQEKHMEELKTCQREADMFKDKEKQQRACLTELEHEMELLHENSPETLENSEQTQSYNLKKIKIYIRKRAEQFRNQIKLYISLLERLLVYTTRPDVVKELLVRCKECYEAEALRVAQIDSMYESEAKYSLQRCESAWQQQNLELYHEVKQLLNDEEAALRDLLNDNLQRQTEIYEQRSTHLMVIENSNDKLKQLIDEQNASPRLGAGEEPVVAQSPSGETASVKEVSSSQSMLRAPSSSSTLPKVTDSFTNLNLDVWENMNSARGGDSPRLERQRALRVVTPSNVERPKFARKRVAWT